MNADADFSVPFPWFGGKSRVAPLVWERFGDVAHYVEPFFGSGAVLLGRPGWTPESPAVETVNDRDGFVSNLWRSIALRPAEVAEWADQPIHEADLHARHCWLLERRDALAERLMGDPDFCDPKIAGWWLWGINLWIGSGWCRGDGPWVSVEVAPGDRQLVHLGNAGMGVHRKLVHLGNAGMGAAGTGERGLDAWIAALSERLRRVRVCCGDWERVCASEAALFPARGGITGVLLDPPYADAERTAYLYAQDDGDVAVDVREWCARWGSHPRLRIALCGYDGEGHDALGAHGWTVTAWRAHGGYGSQGNGAGRANKLRERIWWSPACAAARQASLFAASP